MKRRKKPSQTVAKFPLRQLLDLYGWSQRRLAKASGIDEQRVSDLAQGRHQPTWRTILRIVTTIGADIGDLKPADVVTKAPRRTKANSLTAGGDVLPATPLTPREVSDQ